MSLPTKPIFHTEFDTNQTNTIRPTGSLVTDGYVFEDAPASQHFNWILNNHYLWEEYFDNVFDIILNFIVFDDVLNKIRLYNNDPSYTELELFNNQGSVKIEGTAVTLENTDTTNSIFFRSVGGFVQCDATYIPYIDNTYDLGKSDRRWQDIYATNGTIQTSDRNLKRDIIDLPLGLDFLNQLRTVSYKFVDTETVTHTRRHFGLIAQEVENLLSEEEISTNDFAALVKNVDEETGEVRYAMRYTELIPLCIKAIQEQSAQITALEARVTALENG
jgi:hypothetical protein